MLHDFLQDNLGKRVMLAAFGNISIGYLVQISSDVYAINNIDFHVSEVSSYGYHTLPYIVILEERK